MSAVDTSVIISTYNAPDRLEKTLWGYQAQSQTDFEIIVADDFYRPEHRMIFQTMEKLFKNEQPIDVVEADGSPQKGRESAHAPILH